MPSKDLKGFQKDLALSKPMNERIHDLKDALIVIDGFIRDMNQGYKFDDSFAVTKQKLLVTTFTNLKQEIFNLQKFYENT